MAEDIVSITIRSGKFPSIEAYSRTHKRFEGHPFNDKLSIRVMCIADLDRPKMLQMSGAKPMALACTATVRKIVRRLQRPLSEIMAPRLQAVKHLLPKSWRKCVWSYRCCMCNQERCHFPERSHDL